MHVVYPYCCGLDVHKRSITACVLLSGAGGKGQRDTNLHHSVVTPSVFGHNVRSERAKR